MNNKDKKFLTYYTFWTANIKFHTFMSKGEFQKNLQIITEIYTVENFWQIMCYWKKPTDLINESEIFLFKNKIKPIWEDPNNKNGGKFFFRINDNIADNFIEIILIEFLCFNHDYLNGISISKKFNDIEISFWTKELILYSKRLEIKNWIKKILNIEEDSLIIYKEHRFENNWDNLDNLNEEIFDKLEKLNFN